MTTTRVSCAACGKTYGVRADLAGKRIKCPICSEIVHVPAAPEEDVPVVKPARAADIRRDDDPPRRTRPRDEEEPARRPRAGRDEVEPPRRSRSRRDEDSDDRPGPNIRRKRGDRQVPWGLIILGVVGAKLLLVAVGVAVSLATDKPAKPVVAPDRAAVVPAPPANLPAAGAAIAPADVARVKRSTALIRVEGPSGNGTGTGFFALGPGTVVTNAHALGMLHPDSPRPRRVTVVVNSGEPGEFALDGRITGVDRDNDLAFVSVAGGGRELPPMLAVGDADRLHETQKVYVFGYPLGVQLGRNITVSESSVTSLRRDETNTLHQVQVNGGMHPGNSGGPVTDSNGTVVAVSVAIIRGTQLNFAIPAEFVKFAGLGSLSGDEIGVPFADAGRTRLPVRVHALDPLRRLKQVRVELWAGAPGRGRAGGMAPATLAGDGPRRSATATSTVGGVFDASPEVPAVGPGQALWMQAVGVGPDDVPMYASARVVPFEAVAVLERKAVELKYKTPDALTLRTLRMKNNAKLTLFREDESAEISQNLDTLVVEKLYRDTRGLGTGIRLGVGRPTFTRESPSGRIAAPDDVGGILTMFSPSFVVGFANEAKERGNRSFAGIRDPQRRAVVESLFRTVSNTWEMTTLPFPNRTVRPGESWTARIPMLVELDDGPKVTDLHINCRYEGTRTVGGRVQAVLTLNGEARSREGEVIGKVGGRAVADVAGGFMRRVEVAITTDVRVGEGVRALFVNHSSVEREEGNAQGSTVPAG